MGWGEWGAGVVFCLVQCTAILVPLCHPGMIYPDTDVLRPLLVNLRDLVLFLPF